MLNNKDKRQVNALAGEVTQCNYYHNTKLASFPGPAQISITCSMEKR